MSFYSDVVCNEKIRQQTEQKLELGMNGKILIYFVSIFKNKCDESN
jgi:hypothetical protein